MQGTNIDSITNSELYLVKQFFRMNDLKSLVINNES